MAEMRIIDALYGFPKATSAVAQLGDCIPFTQDLAPLMSVAGIAGAVMAPRSCAVCHHQWNCADRRTSEVIGAMLRNPALVRGLASYDSLRIGESLRWIEDSISKGLSGAYAAAECCAAGLHAPRMYPLYGVCAMLRVPVVLDFASREGWLHHRGEVEVLAADFPELEVVLAPPPRTETNSIVRLMQRFQHISIVLCPQELQDSQLCEFMEQHARERFMFCSTAKGWESSVNAALAVPLGAAARRAYLGENADRIFGLGSGLDSGTGISAALANQ
jgi:predicted TIM-barrel fold metal-dependent hydrolase